MKAWRTLSVGGGRSIRHCPLKTKSVGAARPSFVIHQHSSLSNPPAAPFGLLFYGLIGFTCLLLCARISMGHCAGFVQVGFYRNISLILMLLRSHMHRLGPVLYPLDVRHVETCKEPPGASSDCEI